MLSYSVKNIREISALLLLLFLGSCASYHPAVMPGTAPVPPNTKHATEEILELSDGKEQLVVQVGSVVRIHLTNGDTIDGKVVRVTEKELAFGKTGNYGYQELVIPVGEIDRIETKRFSDGVSFIFAGVGIMLTGFVILFIYLRESMQWESD